MKTLYVMKGYSFNDSQLANLTVDNLTELMRHDKAIFRSPIRDNSLVFGDVAFATQDVDTTDLVITGSPIERSEYEIWLDMPQYLRDVMEQHSIEPSTNIFVQSI